MTSEEKKLKGIIYKYTSPSGKCYIGQTINELSRKNEHKCKSIKSNTKFGKALRKYGYDNFIYEVLYINEDYLCDNIKELKQILDEMEIKYIIECDSKNNGYNLTDGGEGNAGYKHTDDTKNKISNSLKNRIFSEETISKMSDAKKGEKHNFYGTHRSDETKQKISLANTGRVHSKETIEKISKSKTRIILQFSENGELIKEWNGGGKEIEKELGYGYSSIMRWCKQDKLNKDFIWKFK